MSKAITELRIIDAGKNIFDTDNDYIIPLYQRAYAWEDKQLIQLVEDIADVSKDANYYIGSLIVSKQGNKYEVVDGQQRLTSLYLLLNCLEFDVKPTLTFACREKSNYTLQNIGELLQENRSKLDMDRIEPSIQRGIRILVEELNKEDFDKDSFIKKLSNVVVYRIEVPEHTDLNRYFEIMNTRGEQLEQHDILKASLMSNLPKEEQSVFARIWDACSDMTGYVQMHFISKNNEVRENLFGPEWNEMPPEDWNKYKSGIRTGNLESTGHKIANIVSIGFEVEDDEGYLDEDVRVRFESIIDFRYFLIHTLKVLIGIKGIVHEDGSSAIIAELLDDKKLIDTFNKVIKYGCIAGNKISEHTADFSRDFIICLLRTRFLFDKYIIKREFANENSDGEWSLKSLSVSGQKPYYRNTRFVESRQWTSTNDYRTKSNIMIQSALRVSYTSPKVMHWITQLLLWLSEDGCNHTDDADIVNYTSVAENIAKKTVKENFFDVCSDGVYAMGVNTPHIVFNYLDYLIWNNNRKKYDDFIFEFRNSVEHWYPQNPSEGTFEQWKDGVDQFGNLCIIQRNVNSKFSNMSPEAKKSTFREMIAKGSLKLRIMSNLTEKHGNKGASLYWRENAYREHEKSMISLLMQACEVDAAIVFPEDEDEKSSDIQPEVRIGTHLDVSKIVLDWAKVKESNGEIHLDINRSGKRFVRFTTDATSRYLPEAQVASSGWGTKTHYFYEIVNEQGKQLHMQLAFSGKNLPNNLRMVCDKVNQFFPARIQRKDWKWRCPYITKKAQLYEDTTTENIIEILEEQYKALLAFESDLIEKLSQ